MKPNKSQIMDKVADIEIHKYKRADGKIAYCATIEMDAFQEGEIKLSPKAALKEIGKYIIDDNKFNDNRIRRKK